VPTGALSRVVNPGALSNPLGREQVARRRPHLRVLATSRGVTGEVMWRLEPHSPSMRTACFWSAPGNEGRGSFQMPTQKPPSLTSAARVDHLPLGIELAAARRASCRWMNCPSLEGHLGEWAQPRQRTPAHHRSVRAAVEWSSTLLDPVEQGRISESGGVCRRIRCRGRLRRRPPAFRLPCWPVLWICRWSQWFRCGGNDVGDCSGED
jgi:hypothetical protein